MKKKRLKSLLAICMSMMLSLGIFTDIFAGNVYAASYNITVEGTIDCSGSWNSSNNKIDKLTVVPSVIQEGKNYILRTGSGSDDWQQFGEKIKKDARKSPSWNIESLENASINTKLNIVWVNKDDLMNKFINGQNLKADEQQKFRQTETKTIGELVFALLEDEKDGFTEWVNDGYIKYFGGNAPKTVKNIYEAFTVYSQIPSIEISTEAKGKLYYINAKASDNNNYDYEWQYKDKNGDWKSLTPDTAGKIEVSQIEALGNGGAYVRAVTKISNGAVISSKALFVDPVKEKYEQAIDKINEGLGLAKSTVYWRKRNSTPSTMTIDLSIGGKRFEDYFYYGNIAQDLPVTDADSYADYLAQIYLDAGSEDEGLAAVKKVWDRYIYDIYDPSYDAGQLKHINAGVYPEHTYGDQPNFIDWPKDESSSFNTPSTLAPGLKDLDYDYLKRGADYSKAVNADGDIRKTVTAVKAGDSNKAREYNVDIETDVDMDEKAPVAMILQVQSSWQMFDLAHANCVKDDGTYDLIEVGAAASNTELANLYAVKKALLKFTDYMEENYKGNNLLLGITETQHGHSSSMFYQGKAKKGDNVGTAEDMYVTNDYNTIVKGLQFWNTFGNCEHVHYDADNLKNAVLALKSNLAGWTDSEKYALDYEDVRKVAVIVGASTENTDGNDGYGITLPWETFRDAGLNGVYAIRTNEGTPVAANKQGCISWLEYKGAGGGKKPKPDKAGNIGSGKTEFKDGTGDTYTKEYIATTSDAIFNSLVEIADREMIQQGVDKKTSNVFVENLTVTDTVQDEFVLNKDAGIKASVIKRDGTVKTEKTVPLNDPDLKISDNNDGTATVSYNFGKVYSGCTAKLSFGISAQDDFMGSNNVFSNVGKPEIEYKHTVLDKYGNPTSKVEEYSVTGKDTPQVNVPVAFEVGNGSSVEVGVGEEVDLASLDAEAIVKKAHDAVTKYDQTNGTLSYKWELPDKTTVTVPTTVHITNGTPDSEFPGEAELSQKFTPDDIGDYVARLHVTFTPDAVSDEGHFANAATAEAVTAKTGAGEVKVTAKEQKVSYKVRYLEEITDIPLRPDKIVEGVTPGELRTEDAIKIEGYTPIESQISWKVVGNETIIFTYYSENENI